MTPREFLSEAISPLPGAFETGEMARGEPGLPPGFVWRDQEVRIVTRRAAGKSLSPPTGERYVRRHTFTLVMDDGSTWEVYFLRRSPPGARRSRPASRWFLETRTPG